MVQILTKLACKYITKKSIVVKVYLCADERGNKTISITYH